MKAILVVPRQCPLAAARPMLSWLDAHDVRSLAIVPPEQLARMGAFAGDEPVLLVWEIPPAAWDLTELARKHESGAACATLALRPMASDEQGVRVEKDHSGRILRFARHDPAAGLDLGLAGCAVVQADELGLVPEREDLDLVRDFFSKRLREHAILVGRVVPAADEEESPVEIAGGCV